MENTHTETWRIEQEPHIWMKEVLEEEITKGGEAMKQILDFPQVQIKV